MKKFPSKMLIADLISILLKYDATSEIYHSENGMFYINKKDSDEVEDCVFIPPEGGHKFSFEP